MAERNCVANGIDEYSQRNIFYVLYDVNYVKIIHHMESDLLNGSTEYMVDELFEGGGENGQSKAIKDFFSMPHSFV